MSQRYAVRPMQRVFSGLNDAGQSLMEKFAQRREEMGDKHLTHPSKAVQRQPSPIGPAAWAVPRLLIGDGEDAGTVVWDLTFNGNAAHSVTDKFGNIHKPRALVYEDEQPKNR